MCPIILYRAKTVPPTRAERRQKTSIRRRHCTIGTGPNHRRSQRRHLRRNPRPITQTRSLFCTPRRRKQLRDWVVPHTNDSHEAPGLTYEDDDNDTTDFNLSLHMSTTIDEITDDIIPRKSRSPSLAPRQDAPRRRHTAVTQRHAPLSSSSSTDRGFIISKIFTQNAHGLRRRPKDKNENICSTAPHDYTRYEHLITTMKLKQLDIYFIQETWLEGDVYDEIINGYHIFHHNGGARQS